MDIEVATGKDHGSEPAAQEMLARAIAVVAVIRIRCPVSDRVAATRIIKLVQIRATTVGAEGLLANDEGERHVA
jgi:hypothetical protein